VAKNNNNGIGGKPLDVVYYTQDYTRNSDVLNQMLYSSSSARAKYTEEIKSQKEKIINTNLNKRKEFSSDSEKDDDLIHIESQFYKDKLVEDEVR